MKKKGIDPTSKKAGEIKERFSFLSSISESDFNLMLTRIEPTSDSQEKNSSGNNIISNYKESPRKKDMVIVRYGKAVGYVIKNAPFLDSIMLIANIDPYTQIGEEFFYETSSLDKEIAKARKYKLYVK
ncbi:MAG: hypothetical protein U9R34_01480 [Nanoarchaeota archaeon]|nr:hypothetical protein [Nanoarchaeota archaeon]